MILYKYSYFFVVVKIPVQLLAYSVYFYSFVVTPLLFVILLHSEHTEISEYTMYPYLHKYECIMSVEKGNETDYI